MHNIGTMIGFFGILKYALDRVMINNVRHFQEAVTTVLKHSSKLTTEEQNRLALDIGTSMWSRLVNDTNTRNVTLYSKLGSSISSFYCFMVPGFVRFALFIPTFVLTYPA